mmetsp:Transcript_2191/g.8015  ORF Transcript_2191/g.8015 Transcript_2191/m.8015 type:complete len:221 (+) Transcript_2191:2575-3237(+)
MSCNPCFIGKQLVGCLLNTIMGKLETVLAHFEYPSFLNSLGERGNRLIHSEITQLRQLGEGKLGSNACSVREHLLGLVSGRLSNVGEHEVNDIVCERRSRNCIQVPVPQSCLMIEGENIFAVQVGEEFSREEWITLSFGKNLSGKWARILNGVVCGVRNKLIKILLSKLQQFKVDDGHIILFESGQRLRQWMILINLIVSVRTNNEHLEIWSGHELFNEE